MGRFYVTRRHIWGQRHTDYDQARNIHNQIRSKDMVLMNDSKHQTNKIIASRKTESQSSRRSREDLSEDWSLCHLLYIYFRTKQLSEHYFTVQLCSTYFPLKLLTSFPPKMKHLMFKRKFSNSDYGHDDLKNESLPRRDRSKKFSYLIHHQTQR